MLHWNSWWAPAHRVSFGPGRDSGLPGEAGPWAPSDLLEAQARLWHEFYEAGWAWWQMSAIALPTLPLPPAGAAVPGDGPPEPVNDGPAPEAPVPHPEAAHDALRRRIRPEASGPAAAKLKRQRQRSG